MKQLRHYFYLSSALLSGVCLVLMTLLILAQIIARFMGQIIPSSEDFSGWLLSATFFFGLAYTFNTGGHIRVTILLSRLSLKKQRVLEGINLVVGLFISGYMSFYLFYTVYDSYNFQDVSDTYVAMPMWIIQLPMATGALFLFLAIADNFFDYSLGKTPNHSRSEQLEGEK